MTDLTLEHLPFTLNEGVGATAKLGLVALASDYTIEHEFRQVMTDPQFGLFTARIENEMRVTPETLAAMESRIAKTVSIILPGDTLDVVIYGCTSATTVLGEEVVFSRIHEVQPNAKCTTPATAAFAAFNALNAKRIAVLTPYRADVNAQVKSYIEGAGFEVSVFGSFNEEQDPIVARIDDESLSNAIDQLLAAADADMVFVSCTSVRMMHMVAELEAKHGLPVTSSNHALCWHAMRLAGDERKLPEWGRLYSL